MAKYTKPLTAKEDEEGGGNLVKYRLPFALCKERGIELPKWATPRDAWDALKGYGIDPQKEYERLLARKLQAEERAEKKKKERAATGGGKKHRQYPLRPLQIFSKCSQPFDFFFYYTSYF